MVEPIFGTVDLALVSLYLFWLFFAGLIYYLQTENMREGYPLEDEQGRPNAFPSLFPLPRPKTFLLPHGRGQVTVPGRSNERPDLPLRRSADQDGFPFEPTGDPMQDGVGPASWAPRRDVPELDGKGHPKIVPLSAAGGFQVSAGRDPRGLPVQAGDFAVVGSIVDLWIDEPEQIARYLEVDLDGGAGRRLIPLPLARIRGDRVKVHALHAYQFPGVPVTRSRNQVTLLEEEKICAYYAGGKLYASEDRQRPFL
jgi:photosynthetic reaction center H subunit